MERFDGRSKDIIAENIDKLKALFPEVLTEGEIDYEKLLAVLGKDVSDDFEKYELRWHGKMESLGVIGVPITMLAIIPAGTDRQYTILSYTQKQAKKYTQQKTEHGGTQKINISKWWTRTAFIGVLTSRMSFHD